VSEKWTVSELLQRGYEIDRNSRRGVRAVPKTGTGNETTGKKKHKYAAEPTEVDGIKFPSKHEAKAYLKLASLEKVGAIRDLQVNAALRGPEKIRYKLRFDDHAKEHYEPDFVFFDNSIEREVVADAKGFRTETYKKKKRLMKSIHGIEILEL
jgi:hypothetical protein